MVKDISEKEKEQKLARHAQPGHAILLLNNLTEYSLRQGYSEAMIK